MPENSFELRSASDFYSAFVEAEEQFRGDKTSSMKAVSACMFAYHLREWIWADHQQIVTNKLGCEKECDYNRLTNEKCPHLQIVREIANGSKHRRIDPNRHEGRVQLTGLLGGDWSPRDFDRRDFDVGSLTVTTGESEITIEEILSDIKNFYRELLNDLGIM